MIRPFAGTRFNPEHVKLGGVLAPPYDVISPVQRDELYARNMRNIVRVDLGIANEHDIPGVRDRYLRAAAFLSSWLDLGVLLRDDTPGFYVCDHEFIDPDGAVQHRHGMLATVAAKPWRESDLRAHERTMSEPKQDRLALLRATHTQTSPVFVLWSGAPGAGALIDEVMAGPALQGGRIDGEIGSEKLLMWRVSDAERVGALAEAFRTAALYVADGHHRYETAVTYADERRAAGTSPGEAPFTRCLVYLAAADDASVTVLPTHRLVRPAPGIAFGLDDLWARLDDVWDAEPADDVAGALAAAARLRDSHHAFAAVANDGVAVLRRPRRTGASARDSLDVTVLEEEVLDPAGVTTAAITAGALGYTRDPHELAAAVSDGRAILGFGVLPVRTAEVLAIADAGEMMPQKSTYFYPKVPTGLVLYEV